MLNSAKPWEFADKSNTLITSHKRVRILVDGGLYFEACATQATVIEATLFFSMLGMRLGHSRTDYEAVAKGLFKLTLGGLIKRASDLALLSPDAILRLRNYKEMRNFLVHHHLIEMLDFDYRKMLDEGELILSMLFAPLRQQIHEHLRSIGHKDAEKFRD